MKTELIITYRENEVRSHFHTLCFSHSLLKNFSNEKRFVEDSL